jgi:hypothetical protein
MHAAAPANQSRRKHFRVIQYQAVVRTQKTREFAKYPIFPPPFFAMQNQHA